MEILTEHLSKQQIAALSRSELISLAWHEHKLLQALQNELQGYQSENQDLKSQSELMSQVIENLLNRLYGKSSEKSGTRGGGGGGQAKGAGNSDASSKKLPSERYPNAPIIDEVILPKDPPLCPCCGEVMVDSGLRDVTEQLTSKPREIFVLRFHRPKFRCRDCVSSFALIPMPPRIRPGCSYSDTFIIDVALSKFCDLIPIERFCAMAARSGVPGLPPNSLIELTHYLAEFLLSFAKRIAVEILKARVLHADETTHRMLEGDAQSKWYLWGFSDEHHVAFEYQPTRSGEVASQLLIQSRCEVLISDVYSGYARAVRLVNDSRTEATASDNKLRPILINSYCNAHARRKFCESSYNFPNQSKFYIQTYSQIYKIEKELKNAESAEVKRELRLSMHPLFQEMQYQAERDLSTCSKNSAFGKALRYFLSSYDSFIIPVWDPAVDLDNNRQERALRNPVIGRKTWYGTHSVRGAQTAAILLTIIETCRLNHVNPREFFPAAVKALHSGDPPFTPLEYKARQSAGKAHASH